MVSQNEIKKVNKYYKELSNINLNFIKENNNCFNNKLDQELNIFLHEPISALPTKSYIFKDKKINLPFFRKK